MNAIRPKKRFGQHFLKDRQYIKVILDAARLSTDDVVLEIGPGTGVLTGELVTRAGHVVAVEIDRELAAFLKERFASFSNLEVICADILTLSLTDILGFAIKKGRRCKVVANLPYYITTPVIAALLNKRELFELLVVMVQEEVADRMVAQPGTKEYGAFSIMVQFYSEAEVMAHVPRGAFHPVPKVNSAVVRLKLRARPAVSVVSEAVFFDVVRAGFGKRRKMLRNALLGSDLGLCPGRVDKAFDIAGIPPTRRAEQLTLEEFGRLADALICGCLKGDNN
ncbi:MAG TPA: 16S rRNA (adenine(1518)-N(6)/adenine(1519)-N(6))-dimethyltransferase RsmA [Firmicutes bacterium]|nr:16S rRNA (adenine(1518)-N(6)/adenine(1519)-N(6))-dimethyltransferase RsmA [Bacillota bacterium]